MKGRPHLCLERTLEGSRTHLFPKVPAQPRVAGIRKAKERQDGLAVSYPRPRSRTGCHHPVILASETRPGFSRVHDSLGYRSKLVLGTTLWGGPDRPPFHS